MPLNSLGQYNFYLTWEKGKVVKIKMSSDSCYKQYTYEGIKMVDDSLSCYERFLESQDYLYSELQGSVKFVLYVMF